MVITKAASDLCWECQQNSIALVRSQSSTLTIQSEVKLFKLTVIIIVVIDFEEGKGPCGYSEKGTPFF